MGEPPVTLEWHQVRNPFDRRRVVYWRYGTGRGWLGAVSRQPAGWRALYYDTAAGRSSFQAVEMGFFASKREAQHAVEAATRPGA